MVITKQEIAQRIEDSVMIVLKDESRVDPSLLYHHVLGIHDLVFFGRLTEDELLDVTCKIQERMKRGKG